MARFFLTLYESIVLKIFRIFLFNEESHAPVLCYNGRRSWATVFAASGVGATPGRTRLLLASQ